MMWETVMGIGSFVRRFGTLRTRSDRAVRRSSGIEVLETRAYLTVNPIVALRD